MQARATDIFQNLAFQDFAELVFPPQLVLDPSANACAVIIHAK